MPSTSAVQDYAEPTTRARTVTRSRLYRVLDSAVQSSSPQGRVLLLCAPAGTGKTVLLNEWSARASAEFGTDCARLNMTEHENNVSIFCASLLRALNSIVPVSSTNLPPTFDALDRFITELTTSIKDLGKTTTVIIDDAHEIYDPVVISVVDRLLHCAPANLSFIIAARHEPPQSWNSLALSDRLTRLGSAELSFETGEIQEILVQSGILLDDSALTTIARRTQGWGALVRFAAMYLSGRHDIAQAVSEFASTPRPVADFLVGELISSLPAGSIAFLLRTAVPARFTVDLAMVLAGDDAAAHLDELERLNMPLIRTDTADHRTWYTYHPMLREYLYAEYRRSDAPALHDSHMQASRWFEGHHDYLAALEHEITLDDDTRMIELLGRRGLGMIHDGLGHELISALRELPVGVAEDAGTQLLHAAAAVTTRDFDAAAAYLEFLQDKALANAWQCSLFLGLQLETVRYTADSRQALLLDALTRHRASGDSDVDAYVQLQIGITQNLHHEFRESVQSLEKAVVLAQVRNRCALVLESMTALAITYGVSTDIGAMAEKSDFALTYANDHDLSHHPITEQAASVSALAGYLRVTPPRSDAIIDASSLARRSAIGTDTPAYGWHATVIFALQGLELAQENRRRPASVMRDAMLRLISGGDHHTDTLAFLPVVVHACLNVGEPDWALRIVHDAAHKFGDTTDVRLGRAGIRLATGKVSEARVEIDTIASSSPQFVMAGGVYAAVLDACIHARQGHTKLARTALETALLRARSSTALRPFFDLKAEIRPLLSSFSGHFGDNNDFAENLRQRLEMDTTTPRPILTPSELKTLHELSSGDTTEAIAETFGLSVNTVKTHLRGIYRKLEVANRREALQSARKVGLL
ncbi:hypothetical protein B2J88_15860 [Rhodococcus sp. SRB_17]|nr:hypothetical protein [Rhodococcus sp. SRB_17]